MTRTDTDRKQDRPPTTWPTAALGLGVLVLIGWVAWLFFDWLSR